MTGGEEIARRLIRNLVAEVETDLTSLDLLLTGGLEAPLLVLGGGVEALEDLAQKMGESEEFIEVARSTTESISTLEAFLGEMIGESEAARLTLEEQRRRFAQESLLSALGSLTELQEVTENGELAVELERSLAVVTDQLRERGLID